MVVIVSAEGSLHVIYAYLRSLDIHFCELHQVVHFVGDLLKELSGLENCPPSKEQKDKDRNISEGRIERRFKAGQ